MRAAVVAGVVAGVLAAPGTAVASANRMQLACEGLDLVVERANGASWWGSDGAVYTTKHLRVQDDFGVFEKHFGHTASEAVVCVADHDVPGYSSRWTVHLVLAH